MHAIRIAGTWRFPLTGNGMWTLAVCLALAACSAERSPPEPAGADAPNSVQWFDGALEAAFEQARAQNKPVLVYWGAVWCPYCEALKNTVFTRKDFIERSRAVIPVYLDGDLPQAQKWGVQFKVVGYPTLILFSPDGSEIARVAGGMDLEQYASILDRTLADERPIATVIAQVLDLDAQPSAADCRRLAYHAWGLVEESDSELEKRASALMVAAQRCGTVDDTAALRLSLLYLEARLGIESGAIRDGEAPSPGLRDAVIALRPVLRDDSQVSATLDVLVSLDSALYTVVSGLGEAFAAGFLRDWTDALTRAARDTRYGESDRVLALAMALQAQQRLSPERKIDPTLAESVRQQVQAALASKRDAGARADIVNAARIVYSTLGDDDTLYDLLLAELPASPTPYYYMPTLAAIEERRGHPEKAIEWLAKAFAATPTPGARVRWGLRYVQGLIRLTPEDTAAIERAALEVAGAILERDAQLPPDPQRAKRLTDALAKWATTPERKAVVAAVERRLAT